MTDKMNKPAETIPRGHPLRLLWDFVMLLTVLANLGLILFDLTYLYFRPFWQDHFIDLSRWYDAHILGIEPHRLTENYLEQVKRLAENDRAADQEWLAEHLLSLSRQVSNLYQTIPHGEKNFTIEEFLAEGSGESGALFLAGNAVEGLPETEQSTRFFRLKDELAFKLQWRTAEGRRRSKLQTLARADKIMQRIVETNPFANSGQSSLFKDIQTRIKNLYSKYRTPAEDRKLRVLIKEQSPDLYEVASTTVAFSWLWRNNVLSEEEKHAFFDKNIRRNLTLAYYRHIDEKGNPVNNYLRLDAPFLVFFLCEFLISWFLSVRRKEYVAWFLYPLYHWYDVLGLIPAVQFRLFRLIRIYKIYLILKTNQYTRVLGDDIISRTIRYYANIIKEELADMVTLQILSEIQNEVKSGASAEIISEALAKQRQSIKTVTLVKTEQLLRDTRYDVLVREMAEKTAENLEKDISFAALVPAPLRRGIASALATAMRASLLAVVTSATGRSNIEAMIDYFIDEFGVTARDRMVNDLNTAITWDVLENVKKAVAQKKWLETRL